jgi:hypothetical protein
MHNSGRVNSSRGPQPRQIEWRRFRRIFGWQVWKSLPWLRDRANCNLNRAWRHFRHMFQSDHAVRLKDAEQNDRIGWCGLHDLKLTRNTASLISKYISADMKNHRKFFVAECLTPFAPRRG